MTNLHQERRTRWAEALRSGDYTQAMGRLKVLQTDGTFAHCCLGVACEVAIADGLDVQWISEDDDPDITTYTSYKNFGFSMTTAEDALSTVNYGGLPVKVAEYYGVNQYGQLAEELLYTDEIGSNTVSRDLVSLNDRRQADFSLIADQVETNLRDHEHSN